LVGPYCVPKFSSPSPHTFCFSSSSFFFFSFTATRVIFKKLRLT
jgi:hypothetical protein